MPVAWRVVKRRHDARAFDGQGARRYGGRWNSPGRLAAYASSTKSLALLELLVHLDVAQPMPRLVAFAFPLDDKLIERLPVGGLPRHWRTLRWLAEARRIGDSWLTSRRTLALAVPSVVVPEEMNYLLNPEHPAFVRLRFADPTPFRLDRRFV